MGNTRVPSVLLVAIVAVAAAAQEPYQADTLTTTAGDLQVTFLGHASLLFTCGGKRIYVDPYGSVADYGKLPKADLVLVTHEHADHLDAAALAKIRTAQTAVLLNEAGAKQVTDGVVLRSGDTHTVAGIEVRAVPAYNVQQKRANGQPFHPKGAGNGYVLTFGGTRVYVAGDTEDIPEMRDLAGIDVAFLPMNLPYTMTPEMVASAARVLNPKILYPYHFGTTDTAKLAALLKDRPGIEVRIRRMP